MKMNIAIKDNIKMVRSEFYNYNFDYKTGNFARWGKTKEDDPQVAPMSEILDCEITTICKGPGGIPCSICYKGNSPCGENMSLETFKSIIDKMKMSDTCIGINQVALGADASCTSNPDMWDMMKYARDNRVIPNITVADISDDVADKLAALAGAVAVSRYDNKDLCYDSVKKLTDRGMDQVNIHQCVYAENYDQVLETINDRLTDPRLAKMNAIVLLSLKQKGRGVGFTPLPQDKFTELVNICLENEISFGMDSCGCGKFLEAVKDHPNYDNFAMLGEPCESTCASAYCNVRGNFFPCSFVENTDGWVDGVSIVDCDDFVKDIWFNEKTIKFRNKLLGNCRNCPIFNV